MKLISKAWGNLRERIYRGVWDNTIREVRVPARMEIQYIENSLVHKVNVYWAIVHSHKLSNDNIIT